MAEASPDRALLPEPASGDCALQLTDVRREVALACGQALLPRLELFGEVVELLGAPLELRAQARLAQPVLVLLPPDVSLAVGEAALDLRHPLLAAIELVAHRRELLLG